MVTEGTLKETVSLPSTLRRMILVPKMRRRFALCTMIRKVCWV